MATIFERFKSRLTTGQRRREEEQAARQPTVLGGQSLGTPGAFDPTAQPTQPAFQPKTFQSQQTPDQRLQSVEGQPPIVTGGTPLLPTGQERQPTAQEDMLHKIGAPGTQPGTQKVTLEFEDGTSRTWDNISETDFKTLVDVQFTASSPGFSPELKDLVKLYNEQQIINAQRRGDNVSAILNNYFERRFSQENPELAEALKAEVLLRPREFDVPSMGWTWDNVVGVAGEIINSVLVGAGAGASGGATFGAAFGSPAGGVGALPGAIGGAAIGGAGGAITGLARAPGIISKRVQINRDDVLGQVAVARQQEREFLAQAINQVNMGGNKEDALRDFEESVIQLQEKQAWAKEATIGIFGQELQKGRKDLQEITRVLDQEVPRYRDQLEDAMINPNGQMLALPTAVSFQNS